MENNKQETTLEEAAERIYQSASVNPPYTIITPKDKVQGFIAGAKWQQEKMYSEAIEFAEWVRNNPFIWNYPNKLNDKRTTEELFEQFKNKVI